MVARLGRTVGEEFESDFILSPQSGSLCIDPRLELAALRKMKSVEERPLVVADRRCPLTGAHCGVELPDVSDDQFRIQPKLAPCGEDEIAADCVPDRVDRLVKRVPRTLGGA